MVERVYPTVAGVREIAAELGVHLETVKGWRRKGYLEAFVLPGSVSGVKVFDLERVVEWYRVSPPRPGRKFKNPSEMSSHYFGSVDDDGNYHPPA